MYLQLHSVLYSFLKQNTNIIINYNVTTRSVKITSSAE